MDKQRLFDLIEKFKANTATETEIQELDGLYHEFEKKPGYIDKLDERRRETYREMVFRRIHAQINPDEQPVIVQQSKTRKLFWTSVAAAAVILVTAGIGTYLYTNNQKVQPQIQIANDVVPGRDKAILTLANGEKISLTDVANGQVAVQSGIRINKTASGQLAYDLSGASSDEKGVPEYNTIEAPVGGQWQVILPDQSKVWLNALSSITYPTRFTGDERRVKISGEAYFEVSHNKTMPFRVQSQGQTVEVLGTHFNIMAYNNEKLIKTTLLEGSVKISYHGKNELLKPGQQAQVNATSIKVTNDVDLEDVIAWKNGYFKFNESLESIMNKIARWYNVEVLYQGQVDHDMEFEGEISRSKNISSALKIMQLTGNVHFKIEGRRVIVMQ